MKVLSAVAWPYANGPRHLGHVAGFGVPSDVFSRYMRMAGHDVLMVSGSDEHGTPILVLADQAEVTPREFVVVVLKAEFRMTEGQAHRVMITAHRRGVCVVGVFAKDIAETKATRATDAGRRLGYPLLFTTEPED